MRNHHPHEICTPCWFEEHDRCYGCRCTHPDADRPDRNEDR